MVASRTQSGLHEEGRCGFTVSPRNTKHRHGIRGVSKDLSGRNSHGNARIVDDDDRHTRLRRQCGTVLVGEHCDCTRLNSRGSETRPVSMQAVQTDVEIARANLAGVQCDPGDRRTVVISSAAVEGGH